MCSFNFLNFYFFTQKHLFFTNIIIFINYLGIPTMHSITLTTHSTQIHSPILKSPPQEKPLPNPIYVASILNGAWSNSQCSTPWRRLSPSPPLPEANNLKNYPSASLLQFLRNLFNRFLSELFLWGGDVTHCLSFPICSYLYHCKKSFFAHSTWAAWHIIYFYMVSGSSIDRGLQHISRCHPSVHYRKRNNKSQRSLFKTLCYSTINTATYHSDLPER